MTQGASLSLVGTTDAGPQHARLQLVPLSELAIANRQRDALYLLSEQLHRANSLQEIYDAAMDAHRIGARLRSLRDPAVR